MSSSHFGLLPPLALQLAVQVEAYRSGMRLLAAHPRDAAHLAAAKASLEWMQELARPLPPVWTEWARCMAAHADFTLLRVSGSVPAALQAKLLALEACTEALMQRAIRWAVLESHDPPVPVDLAQAFIEWEAARRVLFDLRQAAGSRAAPPADLEGLLEHWEPKCDALLVRAMVLLDAGRPGTGDVVILP